MEVENYLKLKEGEGWGLPLISAFSLPTFHLHLLPDELRLIHRTKPVLPEQLDEFGDAALLIRAEMIMNVPAEIIFPKIQIVFRPAGDDGVEGVETEILGLGKSSSQFFVFHTTPQRPH